MDGFEKLTWKQTYATIEDERIRNHLRNTEIMMRAVDCSHLSKELKKEREEKIKLLHEYWVDGKFPTNTEFPMLRLPHIKDEFGVPCAMAYIIEQSGDKELVKELQKTNNISIKDVNDGPLIEWINKSGITKEEACQIQPNYNWKELPCPPGKKRIGGGNIIGSNIPIPGCYGPDEKIPLYGDRFCKPGNPMNIDRFCKDYKPTPEAPAPIDRIFNPMPQERTRQQKLAERINERREARYESIRRRTEARKIARSRL